MPQLSATQVAQSKLKCQSDTYYMALQILENKDLYEPFHKQVTDFLLQPQLGQPIASWSADKDRLLMTPRGSFKTSLIIAVIIRAIVCNPDIRILIVRGTQKLARGMLAAIKRHFQQNVKLRALFPEFCPKNAKTKWGNADGFTVPNRKNLGLIEPTVMISTNASVTAGAHFDLVFGDDIVHEKNWQNEDTRQNTVDILSLLRPLIDPGGYLMVSGTRYHYEDAYGQILNGVLGPNWKILVRKALTPKETPAVAAKMEAGEELLEQDYDLSFPTRHSFAFLQHERLANPHFAAHYLLDPTPYGDQLFPMSLLHACTIPHDQIPVANVRPYIVWDWAYTNGPFSDRTVGMLGLFDQQNILYVGNSLVTKTNPDQLSEAIVSFEQLAPMTNQQLGKEIEPYTIIETGIENAPGAWAVQKEAISRGNEAGVYINAQLMKIDRQPDAKNVRISSLQGLMRTGRLFFSASLPDLELLYEQFSKYPHGKDDIPDAVSLLLNYSLHTPPPPINIPLPKVNMQQLAWEFIFGTPEEQEHINALNTPNTTEEINLDANEWDTPEAREGNDDIYSEFLNDERTI